MGRPAAGYGVPGEETGAGEGAFGEFAGVVEIKLSTHGVQDVRNADILHTVRG